jgi:hypothetical protein
MAMWEEGDMHNYRELRYVIMVAVWPNKRHGLERESLETARGDH